jgi:hypothetical protein
MKVLNQAARDFYESLPPSLQLVVGAIALMGGLLALFGLTLGGLKFRRATKERRSEEKPVDEQVKDILQDLQQQTQQSKQMVEAVVRPSIVGQANQRLILQFLVLYVILAIWYLISQVYSLIIGGAYSIFMQQDFGMGPLRTAATVIYHLAALLPAIGTAVILILIAWPLLQEALHALHTPLRSLFTLSGPATVANRDDGRRDSTENPRA